ncbi:hypothetical protein SUNI508_10160 [Seiridium unicorne]|uniref:Uncharacterized protein n=1 Tax=Seiridium unicorne TaxID=138068 RepID=A0ABR2UM25_9PEZI
MANFSSDGLVPCSCDFQHKPSPLIDEINGVADGLNAASPLAQPRSISLDDALLLGRRLALEWERANGCFNVEDHLDLAALRIMANTIEKILRLYEVLLESALSNQQSHATAQTGNLSQPAGQSHPPRLQLTAVPTSLGSLRLNEEEGCIVAQEALRHMIARLGDMLEDVEEESSHVKDDDNDSKAKVREDVKRARDLMLRLLGRIPK